MTRALIVQRAGPGVLVQDLGRPGYLVHGVSRGGAADRLALIEGAALLGQAAELAALEMAVTGGVFEATEDMRIALTGAPMDARIEGQRIAWSASHLLEKGAKLTIGAAEAGNYGYLHIGGGIDTPETLGARGVHMAAGIGKPVAAGDRLPVGKDGASGRHSLVLEAEPRFEGGRVRLVPSLQTDMFAEAERARFEESGFTRDTRGNRMGVRFLPDGEGFRPDTGLSILSEVIVPGDVQITGDGTPFVLMAECQTTGGYPRIGSVLPSDLPRVAQARPGARLQFRFVTLDEAERIERAERERQEALPGKCRPLRRDPRAMTDLLSYQLISGVTAGDDLD